MSLRAKTCKNHERGFSLLMAVTITVMLTLVGMMVLNHTIVDTELAGASRNATDALYIAEAGIYAGMDILRQDYGFDGNSPDFNGPLTSGSLDGTLPRPIVASDPDCSSAACKIFGWNDLVDGRWVNYGGGRYRVVVADDSDDDGDTTQDANQTILLRALGEGRGGGRRLLEVAVSN